MQLLNPQFPTLDHKNHENNLLVAGAGTFPAVLSLCSTSGCGIGQHTSLGNSLYFL
jgi:hypothetical protein